MDAEYAVRLLIFVAFVGLGGFVAHWLRKPKRADAAATVATTPDARAAHGASCSVCGSAEARRQMPTISEARSMIDAEWLDAIFLRFGLRREVRHVVVVERDLSVPETLCELCHRIARAACEDQVAHIVSARTARAEEEAARVFDFLRFGLDEALQHRTASARNPDRKRKTAHGADQAASDG